MSDTLEPGSEGLSESGSNPQTAPPVFMVTVARDPFDYLMERHGLLPNDTIRLTVAQELHHRVGEWLDRSIAEIAGAILSRN